MNNSYQSLSDCQSNSLSSVWYLQEFEVIAQIKLLQLASNNYSFTQESHFREWSAGVEKLSEAERSVYL